MAYSFQIEIYRIKLLTEYEIVTKKFCYYRINTAECYTTSTCVLLIARKMPKLPGFDQHLPAKCSVFPLFFSAEHDQSLEIALTNVG
jgi:hypothetical protein